MDELMRIAKEHHFTADQLIQEKNMENGSICFFLVILRICFEMQLRKYNKLER